MGVVVTNGSCLNGASQPTMDTDIPVRFSVGLGISGNGSGPFGGGFKIDPNPASLFPVSSSSRKQRQSNLSKVTVSESGYIIPFRSSDVRSIRAFETRRLMRKVLYNPKLLVNPISLNAQLRSAIIRRRKKLSRATIEAVGSEVRCRNEVPVDTSVAAPPAEASSEAAATMGICGLLNIEMTDQPLVVLQKLVDLEVEDLGIV